MFWSLKLALRAFPGLGPGVRIREDVQRVLRRAGPAVSGDERARRRRVWSAAAAELVVTESARAQSHNSI